MVWGIGVAGMGGLRNMDCNLRPLSNNGYLKTNDHADSEKYEGYFFFVFPQMF